MRTFRAPGVEQVQLQVGSGTVTVLASEDDAVHGEVDAGGEEQEGRVQVETFGLELRVTVPPTTGWSSAGSRIRLRVPVGTDLTLVSGSGDLTADVRLGRVSARSGSGDLRLAATAAARLHTGSGDITVLAVDGEADVSSGSGDIRVDVAGADLTLRSASGDATLGRLAGSTQARLASGDFRLAQTSGSVQVRTASGDISVGVAPTLPAWLDLHSGSGQVDIALPATAEPGPDDPYVTIHARTGSGDIRITRA
ncbi:hypothetical protein GCM10009616_06950 [Microlunatus lacustris]